jgi:hypothetical protein
VPPPPVVAAANNSPAAPVAAPAAPPEQIAASTNGPGQISLDSARGDTAERAAAARAPATAAANVAKSATPQRAASGSGRPPLPPAPAIPPRRTVQIGAAGNGVGEELSALERQRAEALSSRRRERERSRRTSSRRRVVVAVATLIALAAVLVAVFALGGSSAKHNATSPPVTSSHTSHSRRSSGKHAARLPAGAAPRSETSVTVLNGTEKTGLAHRVSAQLQTDGYSRATALSGQPPCSNQATVVEYSSGHQADAEGVAQALGVTQTQALESAVAALAPAASVVVVVGQDEASTSGP